jgi:hypothetical protein
MSEQPTQAFPAPAAAPKVKKQRRWPWAVGGLVLGIILGASGGGSDDPKPAANTAAAAATPAPTVTVTAPAAAAAPAPTVTVTAAAPAPAPAAEPAGAKTTVGNGQWLVGSDVEPGTYKSPATDGGLCYADTNDGEGNINQQEVTPEGPTVITVSKKDKVFKVNGCEDFVKQ